MRLTNTMAIEIDTNKKEYGVYEENQKLANDKLGQLEDIEEELGIDLITLFQAILLKGIYVRCGKMYEHIPPKDLWLRTDASPYIIDFLKSDCRHCLADYGLTWALTKEELS